MGNFICYVIALIERLLFRQTTTKVMWPNGKPKHSTQWRNRKKDGLEELFTIDGYYIRKVEWRRDVKHGTEMIFHSDQLGIKTIVQWKNGLKNGSQITLRPLGLDFPVTAEILRDRKKVIKLIETILVKTKHFVEWKDGKKNGTELIVGQDGSTCIKEWKDGNCI